MPGPQSAAGAFLDTTNTWNVDRLYEVNVNSDEFKELIVQLYQIINNVALVTNIKDSGYYVLTEFVTGALYFPNPALTSLTARTPTFRQVFRKVINFGALPNGTKSVAHGLPITAGYSFTKIYATATNPSTSFIPIPYASATGDNIELSVDATNVTITTASDRTAYTICYAVLEFIKE